MGLHLYSIHHAEHGLDVVERVAPALPGLGQRLTRGSAAIRGAVVLATCNRVEIYLDADASGHPEVAGLVRGAVAAALTAPSCPTQLPLRERHGTEVVRAGADVVLTYWALEVAGRLRRAR